MILSESGTYADRADYPLNIRGELSPNLSRWLWLVKWILAIPHIIVLIGLSIGALAVWYIAFWAILFIGRYPKAMFNYNVGVARWWWRVSFYALRPLGTDRYPPFSLAPMDDYPADVYVQYQERLSRLKVLFKVWLLALPHIPLLLLVGGVSAPLSNMIADVRIGWELVNWGNPRLAAIGIDLIANNGVNIIFGVALAVGMTGALALIAVVTHLFKGFYPRDMFDLQMGLHRYSMRVGGYMALFYDDYPPFRLDP